MYTAFDSVKYHILENVVSVSSLLASLGYSFVILIRLFQTQISF